MSPRDRSAAAIRAELLRLAEEAIAQPGADVGPQRVLRLERAVPPTDLLARIAAQPADAKWYWAARDNAWAAAGAGVAWRTIAHGPAALDIVSASVQALINDSGDRVRVYGGLRFDDSRTPAPAWREFGSAQFFVPRLELRREGERFMLAAHVLLPSDAVDGHSMDDLRALLNADEEADALVLDAALVTRVDHPARGGWGANVNTCLEAFARGEAEKIVLARQTDFLLDEAVRPFALLRAIGLGTPNSYHYCFQPADGTAFVGAPPERLYRRMGTAIETEALAGTRPRGATPEADARLGEELLASDKEQREHAHVSRSIGEVLREFCTDIQAGTPHLHRLGHCQHLLTPLHGTLRDGVDDWALLRRLHPTPAVGGVPRAEAITRIRALEPFDRGWYTGPIGWIGRDGAEFAVAIRSALVHGACVSVYTGGGIVPGSDPDDEWRELESKLVDFGSVLDSASNSTEVGRR